MPRPHNKVRPSGDRKRGQRPASARCWNSGVSVNAAFFEAIRHAAEAEPKPPLLVLVVDDDQAVRDFVDRVLRDAGYRTLVAGSGPEAIELASKGPLDLLLTDVTMPQMTGDELARRLRHGRAVAQGALPHRLSAISCSTRKPRCGRTKRFSRSRAAIEGLLQAVSLLTLGHVELRPIHRACASRGADPAAADPDRHERAPIAEREADLRRRGRRGRASRRDQRRSSSALAPGAQRRAQIEAVGRVQAQDTTCRRPSGGCGRRCGRTARSSTR